MTTEQKNVLDFMQKFKQETPKTPTIPSREIRRLRAELILEEALETIDALGFELRNNSDVWTDDLVEVEKEIKLEDIADGLADLHYVGYCGTGIACGLDMEPIMAEVHRSNMSKLWTRYEWMYSKHVFDVRFYKTDSVNADESDIKTHRNYLCKSTNGKVIKSPSYSPANLTPIIQEQLKK